MYLLNLDITIWAGSVTLKDSDTPGVENFRPPKGLASGGALKVIDPDRLNPFGKIKARAIRFMESRGVRFGGGYLIDPDLQGDIEASLDLCRQDWEAEVEQLAQGVGQAQLEWQDANPDWSCLIARKQGEIGDVRKRFKFGWQLLDASPVASQATGNSTEADIQELPSKAMQALCDSIYDLYAMSFANKDKPSGKAWAALGKLADKADAFGFSNAEAARLGDLLRKLSADRDAQMTCLTLSQMDTPQRVLDILANGVSMPAPVVPVLEEAEQILLAPPVMPSTFNSMGVF